jgi:hypothetical protein
MRPLLLVLAGVLMSLASSISIDHAAKSGVLPISALLLMLTLTIHLIRFRFWGWVLKRYELSRVYPATALFFPLIYLYAIISGQTEAEAHKTLGVILILIGVSFFRETGA